MIDLLLKNSGFYIDKTEHNILESELSELLSELEILTEISPYDAENRICVNYSDLRVDDPNTSSSKSDILVNSKSKTDIGFKVNKII